MAKKKMINSQCRIQTKTCLYALFLSDVLLGLLQSEKETGKTEKKAVKVSLEKMGKLAYPSVHENA